MFNLYFSFSCHFTFEPIFNLNGRLCAFDVHPRFISTEGKQISTEDMIYIMPESVKKEYLIGILNEIEKKTAFLLERKALCSFHIDGVMASIILRDSKIKKTHWRE